MNPNGALHSGTSTEINGQPTVAGQDQQLPTTPADFDDRLEAIAKNIETLQATAIWQIAEQLAKAREEFRYRRDEGGFAGWVETRLHYTRQTAYNLLQVHERFGGQKCQNDLDTLARSILYVIAAPSTPEPAKIEILGRVKAGEKLPVAEAKRIVARHKGAGSQGPRPPKPTDPAEILAIIESAWITVKTLAKIDLDSPAEIAELQAAKCDLEIRVADLEAEVAKLRAENAALRAKLATAQETAASSEIVTAGIVAAGDPGPIPDCLRRAPVTTGASDIGGVTLGDALVDAYGELEDLADECRDAVNNAPEETQRIQTLDETANILEALEVPDVPAELAQIKIHLPKSRKPRTRGDRRNIALDIFSACTKALDAIDTHDPRHEPARTLCGALEDASSDAEGCEFPGWC